VIARLDNTIERYAWGSPTAIPRLLGVEPDGSPQAEMWIGAHPKAPSQIDGRRLDDAIAEAPETMLGARVAARFGERLPFLLKVLAAAEPLSIQCHPDKRQAQEGFARENAAGIPLDARQRNYRDDNHKPELIVALTRFRALKGFRPIEEVRGLGSFPDLKTMFVEVMSWPKEKVERAARDSGDPIVRELSARYPGDPGVLAPLYLHAITLSPGQALFLRDRELHSYLEGVGIEIMANSDNVLRGGLTPKHVDVRELERVLVFEPVEANVLDPLELGGERTYRTPAEEFLLSSVSVGGEWRPDHRDGIEILLSVEGTIEGLPRGTAGLIRGDEPYVLRGEGRVFRARVP
jgi:mannose-6-phosphate isomerase